MGDCTELEAKWRRRQDNWRASSERDLAAANARIAELRQLMNHNPEYYVALADAANARADAAEARASRAEQNHIAANRGWKEAQGQRDVARLEAKQAQQTNRTLSESLQLRIAEVTSEKARADAAEQNMKSSARAWQEQVRLANAERDRLAQKLEEAERALEAEQQESKMYLSNLHAARTERDRLAARVTELESLLANQWPGR